MTANSELELGPLDAEQLASLYLTAKERVIRDGFADEVDWQEEVLLEDLDESTFLRESAWVVLSAGFREYTLRRKFADISTAFLEWSDADSIVSKRRTCRTNALSVFGHHRKIDAILAIAERVAEEGIDAIRQHTTMRGTEFLRELPYIGPVTACHLAKNLGVVMVKPDRHLVRMASTAGCESADRMCQMISHLVGDSLSVIDVVLWRYATLIDASEWKRAVGGVRSRLD